MSDDSANQDAAEQEQPKQDDNNEQNTGKTQGDIAIKSGDEKKIEKR